MIVTSLNLLNFFMSGGFLYTRTPPADPINRRLDYTVRHGIEEGGSNEMSAYRGVRVYE